MVAVALGRVWRVLDVCGLVALILAVACRLAARHGVIPVKPVVLEPDGVQGRFSAVVARNLSALEVESYRRYGLLVVRGVVPDRSLMRDLVASLRPHANKDRADYTNSAHYNGAARALLRQSSVRDPAVELLGSGTSRIEEAPIWGGAGAFYQEAAWHMDSSQVVTDLGIRMISGWLAVTDAPHGLEFLRGTHQDAPRAELFRACNESLRLGKRGERILDPECVARFGKVLDQQLGFHSHLWVDVKAGDAVYFDGRLMHRGIIWGSSRLALSFRLSFSPYEGYRVCDADNPAFLLRSTITDDPFACLRQLLVAPRLSPDLWQPWVARLRLPGEREMGAGALLLRRLFAGLGGVLLSS